MNVLLPVSTPTHHPLMPCPSFEAVVECLAHRFGAQHALVLALNHAFKWQELRFAREGGAYGANTGENTAPLYVLLQGGHPQLPKGGPALQCVMDLPGKAWLLLAVGHATHGMHAITPGEMISVNPPWQMPRNMR